MALVVLTSTVNYWAISEFMISYKIVLFLAEHEKSFTTFGPVLHLLRTENFKMLRPNCFCDLMLLEPVREKTNNLGCDLRSDANQPVQSQKQARSLKFRI